MFSAITMDKQNLLVLCLSSGLIIFEGTITVGLLPVYAVRLGADAATTGFFLAFSFLTLTLGTVVGGWLSDRLGQRKPLLLISQAVLVLAALLMTRATDVTQLTLTSGLMWFPGGVALAMINIITGLSAAEGERGKVFGLMALSTGVGSLMAGLIGGPIAERWGFPTLFVTMAAVAAVMLIIAVFLQDQTNKREVQQLPIDAGALPGGRAGVRRLFYLLLLANLFARLGLVIGDLGRPLAMTQLGFDAAAVSSVIAVSSAIALPLPLLMGWLSDRMGRRGFLVACYAAGAVGLLLLIAATGLWHFWLSASLVAAIAASGGVAQALVVDLLPSQAMGRGLSVFTITGTIAGVVGLSGAGLVMHTLGIGTTLLLGACLPALAIGLVLHMHQPANLRMVEK